MKFKKKSSSGLCQFIASEWGIPEISTLQLHLRRVLNSETPCSLAITLLITHWDNGEIPHWKETWKLFSIQMRKKENQPSLTISSTKQQSQPV
jgi:hypothetical protein